MLAPLGAGATGVYGQVGEKSLCSAILSTAARKNSELAKATITHSLAGSAHRGWMRGSPPKGNRDWVLTVKANHLGEQSTTDDLGQRILILCGELILSHEHLHFHPVWLHNATAKRLECIFRCPCETDIRASENPSRQLYRLRDPGEGHHR